MKRWAIVHAASGAVMAIASRNPARVPAGAVVKDAPMNVAADSHYWNGSAFVAREDAAISLPVSVADVGTSLAVTRPAGAWYARTDGTFSNAASVTVQGGYKLNHFALVGRYRGETSVEVTAAGGAVTTAQTDILANLKREAERRKMLAFTNGFGKAQEYVQKGKEATASAGLLSAVLNALTAASATAQYPMAQAERVMTGDTLSNILASYRTGKASSDAELARLSAIERKAVLAIKAAATVAAKQAAYNAINWSATV